MVATLAAAFAGGFATAILGVLAALAVSPWADGRSAAQVRVALNSSVLRVSIWLDDDRGPSWESINAITLGTPDMNASLDFYERLGLVTTFGGPGANFSSLGLGGDDNTLHVNLFLDEGLGPLYVICTELQAWGRYIVYVSSVDAMHERAVSQGLTPEFEPRDGPWGERYFHIRDPAGHEVSFARKIPELQGCGDHPHCYGLMFAGIVTILALCMAAFAASIYLRRRRKAVLELVDTNRLASSLQPMEAGGGAAGS